MIQREKKSNEPLKVADRAKLLKSLDLAEGLVRVDSNQPPIKPNF